MKWLENFSDAITYIENHLTSEISYDEAAKIAGCSSYYFQRMFTHIVGISLSEYVRCRKMTQAAFDLKRENTKIIDIALKYGYASPTSFNRAFQSVHGISPSASKKMGSNLNAYPALKFSINITGGSAMSYRIEEKEAMRIVGIRIPLVEDMEENQKNVPAFWNEILKTEKLKDIYQLSTNEPQGLLGVTVYRNPREIYYYIAVSTTEPTLPDTFDYEIPAGTWVVFENEGCYKESVQSVFRRFLTEWLPFSGYEYAGLPDIEVYPYSKEGHNKGYSQVWIAIRKTKEEK